MLPILTAAQVPGCRPAHAAHLPSLSDACRPSRLFPGYFPLPPPQSGQFPGGLPSVQDYGDFADTESFRSRSNYHYRLLNTAAASVDRDGFRTYYVAVFNTDNYLVVR